MRKMLFSDLSTHVQTVFANLCEDGVTPEENYEGFKKLTYDLNHNPNEIYDEDGNSVESAPHPQQKLAVDLGTEIEKYDLLRRAEA